MYKNKDKKIRTEYKKQFFILDILSKVIRNLLSAGLLLGFGFWLLMASKGLFINVNVHDGRRYVV